jgi:hypothetical protein
MTPKGEPRPFHIYRYEVAPGALTKQYVNAYKTREKRDAELARMNAQKDGWVYLKHDKRPKGS